MTAPVPASNATISGDAFEGCGVNSPDRDIRSFRLSIEYDGTRFKGWQRQGEAQGTRTVAGVIEKTLQDAGLDVVTLVGSGRTDAGVHALAQVAHLHLGPARSPCEALVARTFDKGLPPDVSVRTVVACDPTFNARHDAVSRSYLYQVVTRRSALARRFGWCVTGAIDPARLAEAWRVFEGFHDVAAFASPLGREDTRCEVLRCETAQAGATILLRVTASHFLRRQARRMVGAAVACGLGLATTTLVARALAAPDHEAALEWSRHTAPPEGLFLEHVRYPGEPEVGPVAPVVRVV